MRGFFFKEAYAGGSEIFLDLEEVVAVGAKVRYPGPSDGHLGVRVSLLHGGEEWLMTMSRVDLNRFFKELGKEEE